MRTGADLVLILIVANHICRPHSSGDFAPGWRSWWSGYFERVGESTGGFREDPVQPWNHILGKSSA